jgi:aminopeptidase N
MKLLTLLPLLLIAIPAASQPSGPLTHIPQPFDVLHYDAELDLSRAPSREMSGVVDISVRWLRSTDAYFAFHLRSLTIDSAWYEGMPVAVADVGDSADATFHHLIIPQAPPVVDDTVTIRIAYHGTMTDELGAGSWGGVGSGDSTLFAMGVGFMNNYVSTTQHWLPSYDHPSDKATFRGRFRTVDRFVTASNGLMVATSASNDTTIYEWSTSVPTATYLLTFATARYAALDFGRDPVPTVVYSRVPDTASTRTSFRLLPRMVRTFSSRFIPYPFEKVGFVNTPIGAMEHQTLVSYPTSLSRSRDTVNATAAHELAHQWFGDLVTPADFRHAWLTESFATFCESLWAEELFGFDGYLRSQEMKLARYTNAIAKNEGIFPLFDFPRAAPSSNYPETIYQKGALVVGMLRYEMGDSAYFAAMRDYLTTYGYGIATTENLRAVLERHHDGPLDWFFDQWVYGKGWPEITVDASSEAIGADYRRVTLAIAQTPVGDQRVYRRLAVPLLFELPGDTSAARSRVVMLDEASQTIVIDSVPAFQTLRVNRGATMRSLLRATRVSGIAGMAADSGAIEFFVKPNPTDGTGALTVQVRGVDDCTGLRYEFYDATGRRLGMGASDRCELMIPTDGIASGAYVIRFRFRELFYDVPVVVAR